MTNNRALPTDAALGSSHRRPRAVSAPQRPRMPVAVIHIRVRVSFSRFGVRVRRRGRSTRGPLQRCCGSLKHRLLRRPLACRVSAMISPAVSGAVLGYAGPARDHVMPACSSIRLVPSPPLSGASLRSLAFRNQGSGPADAPSAESGGCPPRGEPSDAAEGGCGSVRLGAANVERGNGCLPRPAMLGRRARMGLGTLQASSPCQGRSGPCPGLGRLWLCCVISGLLAPLLVHPKLLP